jgi:protein HIRA/HIR1
VLGVVADIDGTGKFRDLQRLTVQYARILGLTADGEEEDSDGDEDVDEKGDSENGEAEGMEVEEG